MDLTEPKPLTITREAPPPGTCPALVAIGHLLEDPAHPPDAGVVIKKKKVIVDLTMQPALVNIGGVLWIRKARLLVVRGKKKYRAFSSICPHKPKKRYRIRVKKRKKGRPVFHCAKHNWYFDHKGRPAKKAKKPMQSLPVKQKGQVLVIKRPKA
ncbi:MAG: Rieske 2Fe-2S domain-containing protein [Acidiferrobacterales bacterium]|nr:Rieske 2Fe-2S domain-containing protein [Acidiferrobacterales bacterium]